MTTATMDATGVQSEIVRHMCQAYAVQIRELQKTLPDIIQQCNRYLDEGKPLEAQQEWKQVVHATQNISRLFNQTANVLNGGPLSTSNFSGNFSNSPRQSRGRNYDDSRSNFRSFSNSGSRGRGSRGGQYNLPDNPQQLTQLITQATRRLQAAAG